MKTELKHNSIIKVDDNIVATHFTDMHQGSTSRAYTCELFKVNSNGKKTLMGKYIMKSFFPKELTESLLETYDDISNSYFLEYLDFNSVERRYEQFKAKEKQIKEFFDRIGAKDQHLLRHHFAKNDFFIIHHDTEKKHLTHLAFTAYENNSIATNMKESSTKDKLISLIKLCSLVNRIHNAGMMLCDLKPENYLYFKDDDSAFIMFFDFDSISEINAYGDCIDIEHSGSKFYSGPECFSGSVITYRQDIFSIGRILTRLMFDDITDLDKPGNIEPENLFSDSNFKALHNKDENINGGFWNRLKSIIEKSTNRIPEERYQYPNLFSPENEKFGETLLLKNDLQVLLEIYETKGVHPEVMRDKANTLFQKTDIDENLLTDVVNEEEI